MEKEIIKILNSIQSDITSMKGDITSMKSDITSMKSEIEIIKVTQDEHTSILRALENKTEVLSAEQASLIHEVAEIKGEVKGIRRDLVM